MYSKEDKPVLLLMLECIEKIEKFAAPLQSADEFEQNIQVFDASLMNFVVIGELVLKLSNELLDKHSDIEWYKIRSFRNYAAHNYFGIHAATVWDIIQNKLPDLKHKIKFILK